MQNNICLMNLRLFQCHVCWQRPYHAAAPVRVSGARAATAPPRRRVSWLLKQTWQLNKQKGTVERDRSHLHFAFRYFVMEANNLRQVY